MIAPEQIRPTLAKPTEPGARLYSLDTYRGLTMLLLAFTVPNYDWATRIAEQYGESGAINTLMRHFEHVEWQGIVLWDMIQPSFMFMVGVSLVYSCNSRVRRGHSYSQMLLHAIVRSLLLILLGVFLRSLDTQITNWTFEDVVTQIGLGYVPLFLLWGRRPAVQIAVVVALLFGYWLLFVLWPTPAGDPYAGFLAHWNKTGNPAQYVDQWFLNLFPRDAPFIANEGGYYTLNFIPALATMISGLLAGNVLTDQSASNIKIRRLVTWGVSAVVMGVFLQLAEICPIVKRIWTPSFALVSSGLCLWILALLYYGIDVLGWQRISFPARVVGMNSMAMYCMTYMLAGWLATNLQTHVGRYVFASLGDAYQPFVMNLTVGVCLWLICFWMYQKRLFLRI